MRECQSANADIELGCRVRRDDARAVDENRTDAGQITAHLGFGQFAQRAHEIESFASTCEREAMQEIQRVGHGAPKPFTRMAHWGVHQ